MNMTMMTPAPRWKVSYRERVVPELMQRWDLKNPYRVPQVTKVVINMSVNEAREDIKALDTALGELAAITGQRPQVRRAKKSISNFKLRAGMPIGLRVTLRGARMYEFLDRLTSMAIPRIRDFRGLTPSGFDGHGNFNLGLTEQHIFPEVDLEKSLKVRGMTVTVVTTAGTDERAREFLSVMGFPFRTDQKKAKGR